MTQSNGIPYHIVFWLLKNCMKTFDVKHAAQLSLVNIDMYKEWHDNALLGRLQEVIGEKIPKAYMKVCKTPFLGFDYYIMLDLTTRHRTTSFLEVLSAYQPTDIWNAIKPIQLPMDGKLQVEFRLDTRELQERRHVWDIDDDDESEFDIVLKNELVERRILSQFYDVIKSEGADVMNVCFQIKQLIGTVFWTHREEQASNVD